MHDAVPKRLNEDHTTHVRREILEEAAGAGSRLDVGVVWYPFELVIARAGEHRRWWDFILLDIALGVLAAAAIVASDRIALE